MNRILSLTLYMTVMSSKSWSLRIYEDVILNGYARADGPVTEIYYNRKGVLVKDSMNIDGSYSGGASLVNSNDFKHLIISGIDKSRNQIGKVFVFKDYRSGFEILDTALIENNRHGSIVSSDFNDDGFEDFFHFGQNSKNERNSKLYINKGNSNFDIDIKSEFQGITSGFATFVDFDGDFKLDLLCSGYDGAKRVFIVYKNFGKEGFVELFKNVEE